MFCTEITVRNRRIEKIVTCSDGVREGFYIGMKIAKV